MRSKEEIEKKMKAIKWIIGGHKSQIIFHLEINDFGKVQEYSSKIEKLEIEYSALEWILNEQL